MTEERQREKFIDNQLGEQVPMNPLFSWQRETQREGERGVLWRVCFNDNQERDTHHMVPKTRSWLHVCYTTQVGGAEGRQKHTHRERERDGGSERGRGLSPGLSRGVVLTVLKTFFLLTIISLSLSLSPSLTHSLPSPPTPTLKAQESLYASISFYKKTFLFSSLTPSSSLFFEFSLVYSTNQSKIRICFGVFNEPKQILNLLFLICFGLFLRPPPSPSPRAAIIVGLLLSHTMATIIPYNASYRFGHPFLSFTLTLSCAQNK